MAKKTTVVTTEEEITPAEEHDKAVLDALESKDELTLDPEKMDEPEAPATSVEEPSVQQEPKIDTEAIKAELKEEVTAEVKKEIEELKKDQTPDEKDEYDKFVEDYEAKNGKTPEWKQVATFLKEQAKSELKAESEAEAAEEEKKEQETIQAQEKQQQELNEDLNKEWDAQLNDLTKSGKIPAIVNPDDNRVQEIKDDKGKVIESIPLEPGKKARYDLFKAMYVASEEKIAQGEKPLTNLKEIFYEHYGTKQPAGANAPIAGTRKSVSQGTETFTYDEIHGKSFEDLLKEAN